MGEMLRFRSEDIVESKALAVIRKLRWPAEVAMSKGRRVVEDAIYARTDVIIRQTR